MQIPRGMHANLAEGSFLAYFRVSSRSARLGAYAGRNSTRRMAAGCVFKAMGHRPRAGNGNAMKTYHQTTPVGGMRRLGTVFIRITVGLLLGSAITVAVVAAGLDLLPLWP